MTDADKKLLTEFLGECWHEPMETANAVSCGKCGTVVYDPRHVEGAFRHLDFTDWRTIGKGVKKLLAGGIRGVEFEQGSFGEYRCIFYKGDAYGGLFFGPDAENEEEAFWSAVIAYLKESKP